MNIRERKQILSFAAQRVRQTPQEKRIVAIYAAITMGLSVLVTVINYVLGLQMDKAGGLSGLGTRTMLSSMQSMLPIALSLFTMCLDVGYFAVMLRIARGQYVSEQTLRLGFDRFWVLLRCNLFKILLYTATVSLGVYLGVMLYMITPLADPMLELLTPYMSAMTAFDNTMMLDEAFFAQFNQLIWPAYLICAVMVGITTIPMFYSYRMVNYVIIDKPALGAMAALRESKFMMRRNRVQLFRLDLRLWWYYLAMTLVQVICYGDVILPMLGVELPGSPDLWYFVFLALYAAVWFALQYFLRSRAEVAYGIAYDAVKPEEKKSEAVVLGNIFQGL